MKTGLYRDPFDPRAWNAYVFGRWRFSIRPTPRRPYFMWAGRRAVITYTWYEGMLRREVIAAGRGPDA